MFMQQRIQHRLRRPLREKEREDFTSSANQLGCTDVLGSSVTWLEHQY